MRNSDDDTLYIADEELSTAEDNGDENDREMRYEYEYIADYGDFRKSGTRRRSPPTRANDPSSSTVSADDRPIAE
jgi:hypothetical protein